MGTPRQDIPAGPMKLEKLTGINKVKAVFWNFVHYFRTTKGWRYEATKAFGDDILDGKSGSCAYCDNLTQAFMILVRDALGPSDRLRADRVQMADVVMTPNLSSLLPSLAYNVRLPHNSYASQQQYLFNRTHVYCKIASRYYDPLFGVSGMSQHFHIDWPSCHTVAHGQYPDLAGTLEDALIPQTQADVIYRAMERKGDKPRFVRLTPENLGKKALKALMKYYNDYSPDDPRLKQWAKKYKKAKPGVRQIVP